jgi:hypothetical protein
MKYTLGAINQIGIVDAGLDKKTDVIDWCILDYIFDWKNSPKANVLNGMVWLSYSHFIKEMPLLGLNDKSSVSKRVKKLKELKLIDTFQSPDDMRLYAKTTDLYYSIVKFSSVASPVDDGQHPVDDGQHPVDDGQHPVDDGQHSTVILNNSNTKEHKNKPSSTDQDDAFNEFYSAYPKKVGKEPALKSWKKIKPALYETIIADVKNRAANHIGWQDKQFIPNPATYLNQKRWEDELNPIRQPQKNNVHPINQPRSQMLVGVRFGNF